MKVAYTELRDLLHKAFEGIGFAYGDYQDCGDAIMWLEVHGLPFLSIIEDIRNVPTSRPVVLEEDRESARLNGRFNGSVTYGGLALDLAYMKAQTEKKVTITVSDVVYPQLTLAQLSKMGSWGMPCLLNWHGDKHAYHAFVKAGDALPTIISTPLTTAQSNDLTIHCGTRITLPSFESRRLTPPSLLYTNYIRHLNEGIFIDDVIWQHLIELSKNVLVAETAVSRQKGAGENA